ncbi:ABC transporter ATP-binding protein [Sandaracinobacteroides saxicola]|uniref:ABC transporter ATP-binding protein n=1 Tax=Sandaracinobacteroides saxicola TaxID=2759707 RepID=A0A7G5IKI8_9SPHN|nr:ABC transporter ATP-binding protein [Sandaracinobacteroides saxicola]QMW23880.1 ABC transporter ATP-binding protein [Sandaracinobacteroides saxicola]
MSAAAIVLDGITKGFGSGETRVEVLHGISSRINAGELTYLVGESGSGKTTLISIIAGILFPDSGGVELFGTQLYDLSKDALVRYRLANIGFIFQQYNLLPTLNAAENAAVPLIAAGVKRAEAVERGAEVLGRLGLGALAKRMPRQLSGGQQQRVAIARALVHEPRLIVCDEPTAALDAASGRRVMEVLREVALVPGRAVLIVTHDNRIFPLADRIIGMEDGRITSDGKEIPAEDMHA